jgi:hypothetical protein
MKSIHPAQVALALTVFQIAAYSQGVPYPGDAPSVHVVRVISAGPAQRDAFVACLAQNDLPFWRGLKQKGLLAKVSVFETTSVTSSEPGVPAWNFVISSHLAEGANADSFVQAVEKRKGCENAAGVEVRRTETMRTPPNWPNWARETAADDLKARELKVEFSIEYIAVKDTPEALHRWSEFVRVYEGPPGALMIRDGWQFSVFGVDTVKVNYRQSGMPNWRHIAFFGRIPGKDPTARKAALDAARNELIPGGIAAWTAESAAIHSIETYPRVENARQLFELALR